MKSSATANPVLSGHAVKFMQTASAFVAMRLFPLFFTGEQSADYYVFDEENFLSFPTDIKRAPGGNYSRSLMKLSDDQYACREYGHEEPVDDRERKKYSAFIDADIAAVARMINVIRNNHELRVKAMATDSSVPNSSPGTKWDQSDSTPITDIKTARLSILKNCGMRANTLVLNEDVAEVLYEHPDITGKITDRDKLVTDEFLARVFRVDRVLVARGIQNSAAEGQALSPAFIWGDSVILAHVNSAQDLRAPNFGRTFAWTGETGPDGVIVESYREDKIRSDVHRARHDVDEKLVGAKCGYHLSNVLAA